MVESNYDILGVSDGSSRVEIRSAFRKLVLEHHSDRGGDDEQFKRIKQAFDDLKIGKKYPDSKEERKRKRKMLPRGGRRVASSGGVADHRRLLSGRGR